MKNDKINSEVIADSQQPQPLEDTLTPPEQEAGTNKKEKKPSRRKRRKELRRELRRQKKEAYRSKTFLGKIFHALFGFVKFLFLVALIVTVVRVNYKEVGAYLQLAGAVITGNAFSSEEVTQEQIYEVAPLDEERGAAIDASAPIGEDETWGIYMYIVGSNLEADYVNQLSDLTTYLTRSEALAQANRKSEKNRAQVIEMMDTILENDLKLPNVMYAKSLDTTGVMQSASQEMTQYLYGMFGDSHAASEDIEEILAVSLPENVKVVLQPGGSISWGNNMINPNNTQRFLYDSHGMQQVYNGHVSNMADPETLVDFLTYCEEEYPADHTMVIFWNHGAGAFGFGVDSIYLDDLLTLQDIRWAFEQVYTPDEENPPIDLIGFDACLMASMEVANTFHGFGGYLIGSEEVEPGSGWDYTAWLGALAEDPTMNAQQIGKAVSDSYMDYYGAKAVPSGSGMQLFSMLDLSYADDLYDAYSDFAEAALSESVKYAGTAAQLGKAANSSIKFAGNHMNVYNTVDLGLFMQAVDGNLEKYSRNVLDVMDDMVLYNRACKNLKDSTGITVYYPAAVEDLYGLRYASDYINNICTDPSVQALYYYKVAGCLPEDLQEHVSELGLGELPPMNVKPLQQMEKADFTLLEGGNFAMDFDDAARSITQEYRYNLLQVQEDGTVLRMGYDDYLTVNEQGQLVSEYDGKWATIDGQLLFTRVVGTHGDIIRYCAPILYNSKNANLLLSYDTQTGENTILGVQLINDSSEFDVLTDRQTVELKAGDLIQPVYETYDIKTGIGQPVTGSSFTYKEDTRIVDESIPNGGYMSYISLVDARGDIYDMKLVSFDMKRGTISNSQLVDSY